MNWKTLAAVVAWCGAAGTAGAVGRVAEVTVHDRTSNRALEVYRHEGRLYVVGQPGHVYQVRVRNRTAGDILAVVSVDGVNAVTGETADWRQTGYVLGRHAVYDIRGWRKSERRIAAFYFTEHRRSYAARTGRPDHVGVIGVALFRRQAQPEARLEQYRRWHDAPYAWPEDESADAGPAAPAAGAGSARAEESAAHGPRGAERQSRRKPALGTGHGRNEASHVTYTTFERATAMPEEVVAIHYDSHANLVALGVIRSSRASYPVPFPGRFVPDPR